MIKDDLEKQLFPYTLTFPLQHNRECIINHLSEEDAASLAEALDAVNWPNEITRHIEEKVE